MVRTKRAMPPMTPPTIAPAFSLDEVKVWALDADVLLREGEVLIGLDEVADIEAVVEIVVVSRSCTRTFSRFSPSFLI